MRKLQRNSLGVAAAVLIVLSLGVSAEAQEASPWSLTFSHKQLDVITVPYKDGSATTYYYMLFTLKNGGKGDAPLGVHLKAYVGPKHPNKMKTHLALPNKAAEDFVRRIARDKDIKNVQEINAMGTLKAGASVKGIAVFQGTFNPEWDKAVVTVSGLEAHGLKTRVRKYEGAGFTLSHKAYSRHNAAVLKKAGDGAEFTEAGAIVRHEVLWVMRYHREGDEYSPQLDPILLDGEGWDVAEKPGPKIVMELEVPFAKK